MISSSPQCFSFHVFFPPHFNKFLIYMFSVLSGFFFYSFVILPLSFFFVQLLIFCWMLFPIFPSLSLLFFVTHLLTSAIPLAFDPPLIFFVFTSNYFQLCVCQGYPLFFFRFAYICILISDLLHVVFVIRIPSLFARMLEPLTKS